MQPKTIPYNLDAEEATLGSILIDPECAMQTVGGILKPEHFYLQKHQWLMTAMNAVAARGDRIDFMTVITELEKAETLNAVGGAAYISQLLNCVPSALNVEAYAKLVHDSWVRRKLLAEVSEIARLAYDEKTPMDGNLMASIATMAGLVGVKAPDADAAPAVSPLPDAVLDRLHDADPGVVGHWLATYTDYARAAAPMTPDLFHESAALWLVSVIVARRLVLRMPFDDIYPNIWLAWLAPSTLFRKSTAMNVAVKTIARLAPHLLSPQESTPEAFIRDMSGMDPENLSQMRLDDQHIWQEKKNYPAQRGWSLDEFSGLLAAAGRDYNAGLIETLLRLYDCGDYSRSTSGKGIQVVHNSYLAVLGASTPAAMAVHLNSDRLWGMGWWPRFALLTPAVKRPEWREPWYADRPPELDARLLELNVGLPAARWPDPVTAMPVTLGTGVYETWTAYNKAMSYDLINDALDARLWYTYGRLPTHVLKVGMLLAAVDGGYCLTMNHLARAIYICEEWRESAHRALATAAEEAQDRLKQRIIFQISKNDPYGVTVRDLYKALKGGGVKASEIERTLQELLTGGDVTVQETGSPRGGPKVIRYFLARD